MLNIYLFVLLFDEHSPSKVSLRNKKTEKRLCFKRDRAITRQFCRDLHPTILTNTVLCFFFFFKKIFFKGRISLAECVLFCFFVLN